MTNFNEWLGIRITNMVGTMWAAYAFAALALVSLPAAIATHSSVVIVGWIAQTFLQLVLLSIIMVGQGLSARKTEQVIRETHDAVLREVAELRVVLQELQHLSREVQAQNSMPAAGD